MDAQAAPRGHRAPPAPPATQCPRSKEQGIAWCAAQPTKHDFAAHRPNSRRRHRRARRTPRNPAQHARRRRKSRPNHAPLHHHRCLIHNAHTRPHGLRALCTHPPRHLTPTSPHHHLRHHRPLGDPRHERGKIPPPLREHRMQRPPTRHPPPQPPGRQQRHQQPGHSFPQQNRGMRLGLGRRRGGGVRVHRVYLIHELIRIKRKIASTEIFFPPLSSSVGCVSAARRITPPATLPARCAATPHPRAAGQTAPQTTAHSPPTRPQSTQPTSPSPPGPRSTPSRAAQRPQHQTYRQT